MARTPVWVIKHFRCPCALNSPSYVFLFSGRSRELAKPRSAGDDCITHNDTSLPKHGIQSTSLALCHIFNPCTAHFHHHSTQRVYKLMSTWASKRSSYHFCWALKDVSRPMSVPYQPDSLHQNPIFLNEIWRANKKSKATPTCKLKSMWPRAFTLTKEGRADMQTLKF